ncbi:MAG: ABC transporter permease, partial [Cetobacterium sp.]
PASSHSFFSALKMSVPLSLIGASIGEWLGATSGLGYFSKRMMSQLDGAGVFAPIVIISLLAIFIVQIISLIESKTLHWRNK